MRNTVIAALVFTHAMLAFPALAQQGCPVRCPEGTVWSYETNKCEAFKPMMV